MGKNFLAGVLAYAAVAMTQQAGAQVENPAPTQGNKNSKDWVAVPVEETDGTETADTVYLQAGMMEIGDSQFKTVSVQKGLNKDYCSFVPSGDRNNMALEIASSQSHDHCYTVIVSTAKYARIGDKTAKLICDANHDGHLQTEGKNSEIMFDVAQFYNGNNNPKSEAYVAGEDFVPNKQPWSSLFMPMYYRAQERVAQPGSFVTVPVAGSAESVAVDGQYYEDMTSGPFYFNCITSGVPQTMRDMLSEEDRKNLETNEAKHAFYTVSYTQMSNGNEPLKSHMEIYGDFDDNKAISPYAGNRFSNELQFNFTENLKSGKKWVRSTSSSYVTE